MYDYYILKGVMKFKIATYVDFVEEIFKEEQMLGCLYLMIEY